jgi:hypothetical protein
VRGSITGLRSCLKRHIRLITQAFEECSGERTECSITVQLRYGYNIIRILRNDGVSINTNNAFVIQLEQLGFPCGSIRFIFKNDHQHAMHN